MQETANKVASSACMTFEEWASKTIDIKNGAHFEKNNHGLLKDIILHGHCHEKALNRNAAGGESLVEDSRLHRHAA